MLKFALKLVSIFQVRFNPLHRPTMLPAEATGDRQQHRPAYSHSTASQRPSAPVTPSHRHCGPVLGGPLSTLSLVNQLRRLYILQVNDREVTGHLSPKA